MIPSWFTRDQLPPTIHPQGIPAPFTTLAGITIWLARYLAHRLTAEPVAATPATPPIPPAPPSAHPQRALPTYTTAERIVAATSTQPSPAHHPTIVAFNRPGTTPNPKPFAVFALPSATPQTAMQLAAIGADYGAATVLILDPARTGHRPEPLLVGADLNTGTTIITPITTDGLWLPARPVPTMAAPALDMPIDPASPYRLLPWMRNSHSHQSIPWLIDRLAELPAPPITYWATRRLAPYIID